MQGRVRGYGEHNSSPYYTGLTVGEKVNTDVIDGSIAIKQVVPTYKLDDLLAASPDDSWALDRDDEAWLNDNPQGSEGL